MPTSSSPKKFTEVLTNSLMVALFTVLMLTVGIYTVAALSESSTLIPVILGSICAIIGLVCNVTFNYIRTLEGDVAKYFNQRAGFLSAILISMVGHTLGTLPFTIVNLVDSSEYLITQILQMVFILYAALSIAGFIMRLLAAIAELNFFVRFMPLLKEDTIDVILKYESPYETLLYKLSSRLSKAAK